MKEIKFWLVSANMGYGHNRAIFPLLKYAYNGGILEAGGIEGLSRKERNMWLFMLWSYETASRGVNDPFFGRFLKNLLYRILYIPRPGENQGEPSPQVKALATLIKHGLCQGVLDLVESQDLPMITSFYAPSIAADYAGNKNVFLIICDTDINRVWVSAEASKSSIIYFVPEKKAHDRLIKYGVPANNIFLTGFPLPLELLGNRSLDVLIFNFTRRLKNIDPNNNILLYKADDPENSESEKPGVITITFSVGGAGAQKEIAAQIIKSMLPYFKRNQIRLVLSAGTRKNVYRYFKKIRSRLSLGSENVSIIYATDFQSYYESFNKVLSFTDILWTKPGELSFYCALGLPIIISPPIGPQEEINRQWLLETGSGLDQEDPANSGQWLTDLIVQGKIRKAAWNGYMKAKKTGTFNIIDYMTNGTFDPEF